MRNFSYYSTCGGIFLILSGVGIIVASSKADNIAFNVVVSLIFGIGISIAGIVFFVYGILSNCNPFGNESDTDVCGLACLTALPLCSICLGIGLIIGASLFSADMSETSQWAFIWLGAMIILFSFGVPLMIYLKNKKERDEEMSLLNGTD